MIENGLQRAKEFSYERIARRWYDVLSGPVAEGYERWRRQRAGRLLRPIAFAGRALMHMGETYKHRYALVRGERILDGP
jgi:hypothetical protein